MNDTTKTRKHGWLSSRGAARAHDDALGLVIAWSLEEPARVGEIAFVPPDGELILGRGAPGRADPAPRLAFVRQRPARNEPAGPLVGAGLSRSQLRVRAAPEGIEVTRVGRCPMHVNGAPADDATVGPGDTVLLEGELLLLCVTRPPAIPGLRSVGLAASPFGEADDHGLVGESHAMWRLRDEVAFVGARQPHVLVLGESGVGKELVARAIHALSSRAAHPLVSRNASTLPPGLVDAELFGNARSYPHPGLAERPGLLGEADRGTLFLDEIGEMSLSVQAHLLRVLDAGGEYQRLGDARVRSADVRLVAATNRPPAELKHDFLARLSLRIEVPGLGARREDIPLLARHLLRRVAERDPALGERFFEGWDGATGNPRVSPELMDALVRHRYTHHVRELATLLWSAVTTSDRHYVDLTSEVRGRFAEGPSPLRTAAPTEDDIRASLERHGGNVSRASRALGLSSRDALYRLMKKLGIRRPPEP